MVGMVEPEVEGFSNRDGSKVIALSRCTFWERPPLLKCSLPLASAAKLLGKVHEVSGHTLVITVVH